MDELHKYPRTPHVYGSCLQPGDEDLPAVPFREIQDKSLIVEEKIDGANAAFSFGENGILRLQSRGHYLTGGLREKHFELFKAWAASHQHAFWERLGSGYVVYGEWVYAKHTVFYDFLPHYFLEFDILDLSANIFLSTPHRRTLLAGLPVVSVPIVAERAFSAPAQLQALIGPSCYKSIDWKKRLSEHIIQQGLSTERIMAETDQHDEAEGLYLKVEDGGQVIGRYKYVRASFLTAMSESGTHWLNQPIVPNILRPTVDLFGPVS
jgi:hypothetical protein